MNRFQKNCYFWDSGEGQGSLANQGRGQILTLSDFSTAGTVGEVKPEETIISNVNCALKDGSPYLGHYDLAE